MEDDNYGYGGGYEDDDGGDGWDNPDENAT